jgi:membrane protein implicated in regulation of membrane protease activity
LLPLAFYVGSLAFGGILLAASLFGAGDHHHDVDHGGETDHGHGGWFPFLSLRFWTFALSFFGLTGTALSLLGLGTVLLPAIAGAIGLGAGVTASRLFQRLAGAPVGLLAASPIGREGKLLLPVAKGQPGKLRLSVGGVSTDLVAETEAGEALTVGTPVLIVGLRGNVALVERSPASLPPVPSQESS